MRNAIGRNSSDYTAAIIGVALNVDQIDLWTDVNGIMSADPKITKDAISWSNVDYNLMAEISYSGAQVTHPKSIEIAIKNQIPIKVLNTFNQDFMGTKITNTSTKEVLGVIQSNQQSLINITSFARVSQKSFLDDVNNIFKNHNIDIVSTSETVMTIAVKSCVLSENFKNTVKQAFGEVYFIDNLTKVNIIKDGIAHPPARLSKICKLLESLESKIYSLTINGIGNNITFMIDEDKSTIVINKLHKLLIKPVIKLMRVV